MASDSPGDTSVSVELPESLSHWLDDRASEEGRSREDLLLQLLSAYRKVDGLEDGDVDPPVEVEEGEDGGLPAGIEEEIAAQVEEVLDRRLDEPDGAVDADQLDRRFDDMETRFGELLEDVRERVVQVKREVDAKAPEDHDHPDLEAAVEELGELEDLQADLTAVESAVDRLDARLEAGFDNYEEVLEYLADAIDTVTNRQRTLAKALVETREELRKLAARDSARSAVESLKREAAQRGVRTAACGECGASVDVGLLTRAECPHCSATVVGVEPARGFFGSDTLATGNRPALEAGDPDAASFEHGVGDIADSEREAAADSVRADIEDDAGSDGEDAAAAADTADAGGDGADAGEDATDEDESADADGESGGDG
jgi:predicted Zn-ribbon and HTH transcriptional regulator